VKTAAENGWKVDIVTGEKDKFVVVKKRWVAEKAFGWFYTSRRLNRDYKRTLDSSETTIPSNGSAQYSKTIHRTCEKSGRLIHKL
jgi:transposase